MPKKSKKKSVKNKSLKKVSKKKTTRKKVSKPKVSVEKVRIEMQPILVDNFTALQRVMMNMAEKLSDVSDKMEKLLELFETSAKTLAKKDFKLAGETSPEIIKKLNDLSEQNKVIARGLTLLHEPAPVPITPPMPAPVPMSAPKPSMPPKPSPKKTGLEKEEYKKSISFKPLKSKK